MKDSLLKKLYDTKPELKYWHPLCLLNEISSSPKKFTISNLGILVFKNKEKIQVFPSVCVHRGMDLSRGKVVDGNLLCPYHSWSYNKDYTITCHSNSKFKLNYEVFDTKEEKDVLWICLKGSNAPFPTWDEENNHYFTKAIKLPVSHHLNEVLDNFSEVEHLSTVHYNFGYDSIDPEKMEMKKEFLEDSINVQHRGTQGELEILGKLLREYFEGDQLNIDWVTRFDPIRIIYDHKWIDKKTGKSRVFHPRLHFYFVPEHGDNTTIFVFCHLEKNNLNFLHKKLLSFLIHELVRSEGEADFEIISNLDEMAKDPSNWLTNRHDQVLIENRKRVKKIYFQKD